jgi:hypothetical protein
MLFGSASASCNKLEIMFIIYSAQNKIETSLDSIKHRYEHVCALVIENVTC